MLDYLKADKVTQRITLAMLDRFNNKQVSKIRTEAVRPIS